MTQGDIQNYYRDHWKSVGDARAEGNETAMAYSSPVEDAVIYPVYERLIADLGLRADGHILDVGSGSGRWARFFLDRYAPASLTGVDFAEASATLLNDWAGGLVSSAAVAFHAADITSPGVEIPRPEGAGDGFDLINIGNVLFHIPEPEKFEQALVNTARLLAPGGRAVTTEYMPRASMRTNWMAVRSRYEFEAACGRAGLEIADVRACSFFSNDPMGIDGLDDGTRLRFNTVRQLSKQLVDAMGNEQSKRFAVMMLAEIEHACLRYCAERVPAVDMPAQKLVVLRKKG